MNQMRQQKKTVLAVLILLFAWASASVAHKVSIFAWIEDGTVYTQSKFSGGGKVVKGKVEVFDQQGKRLLEGVTNKNGEFSFRVPVVTDLKIVLTAGMGHRNSWTLTADEMGATASESAFSSSAPSDSEKTVHPSPPPVNEHSGQTAVTSEEATSLSADDVETIVAQQLEKKLAPLTRMIAAEQDKGPTFSDILGGIGYILGLVGLVAYMRYRKEDRRR
jgi:nickel transport protein